MSLVWSAPPPTTPLVTFPGSGAGSGRIWWTGSAIFPPTLGSAETGIAVTAISSADTDASRSAKATRRPSQGYVTGRRRSPTFAGRDIGALLSRSMAVFPSARLPTPAEPWGRYAAETRPDEG